MSAHERPSAHVLAVAARLVEDGHEVTLSPSGELTAALQERHGSELRHASHCMLFVDIDTTHMNVPEIIHLILVKKMYPEHGS